MTLNNFFPLLTFKVKEQQQKYQQHMNHPPKTSSFSKKTEADSLLLLKGFLVCLVKVSAVFGHPSRRASVWNQTRGPTVLVYLFAWTERLQMTGAVLSGATVSSLLQFVNQQWAEVYTNMHHQVAIKCCTPYSCGPVSLFTLEKAPK